MVWKKDLTALGKGGKITKHPHKDFKSQPLHTRNAMSTLHAGGLGDRQRQDYAKGSDAALGDIEIQPTMHGVGVDSPSIDVNDHDEYD